MSAAKTIVIDPHAPARKTESRLQLCHSRAVHTYLGALNTAVSAPDTTLPDADMPFVVTAQNEDRSGIPEGSCRWLLACAIREISEVLDLLLDEVKLCLAVLSASQAGRCTGADMAKALRSAAKFKIWSTKQRLRDLAKKHRFTLSVQANLVVLSLKRIRNCLVHRLGLVGAGDVKGASRAAIHWKVFRLFASDGQSERPCRPGIVLEAGTTVLTRVVGRRTVFGKGDEVKFGCQDFYDALCSAWLVTKEVDAKLAELAAEKGLPAVEQKGG